MAGKDDIKSLYDGLINKGYTTSDLGDENTFRKKMQDKNNRKELYDYVSGRNDFRIGDYDSYEKRLSSNYAPVQSNSGNETRNDRQADKTNVQRPAVESEQPVETVQQPVIEPVTRQSLREQVEGVNGFYIPSQAEMQAKFDPNGNGFPNYAENIRKMTGSGQLDTIINKEEENRLNRYFKPSTVKEQGDIYQNYADRFSNTQHGQQLYNELTKINQEISSKYADEYLNSPEYKQLASQYTGEELDRRANEQFEQMYGELIQSNMEPYERAYSQEVMNRYGNDIERETNDFIKKQVGGQLNELSTKVNDMISQRGKELESESAGKWWRDLPRGGGGAVTTVNFASNQGRNFDPTYQQLQAASSLIDNSQDIINEASKKGNTNFVAGLGRGIRDSFSADNWTFGLTELSKNMNLNQVLDKADKGEKLTDSEQALLDALVTNMAVNAYYSSDLGRGYQAGQTTGASIPFMLEFAVNPVSASGSGIAKSILRYGARRFGLAGTRGAARKAALSGARLVGDAAAAAAMTGTTGLPGVAAETQQRIMGDINPVFNEEGRAEYGGRQNRQGLGEAIGKSVASRFLENQSEMVFNAFPGIGNRIAEAIPGGMPSIIQRFGQTRIGQSVRDLYKGLKNNELVRDIAQRTQFHGLGEEYLEEVYNNFANIPLGDMTFEDAISLDQNINTLLGLAPTSVAFSMLGLAGLARERYNNRKNMQRIFGRMTPSQQRMFNELQEMSRQNGNDDIKRFIKATIEDPELTTEQKKEGIQYAWEIARNNAIEDVQEEETQEQVDAENADIDAHTDPKNGLYTEMDRIVVNEKGEQVRVPGYKTGEIGGAPVWVPEGAEITQANTVVLKPGEWDESTVRSMPADEVKSENEAMIREDVQARAEQESTYSPDIPPLQVGLTFSDGTDRYEVIQQNPDGGWIAQKTSVDEKGKETQSIVPIDEQSYRNIAQANIDMQESAQQAANSSESERGNTKPYSVNDEAVNNVTIDEFLQTGPYNREYYEEHPERMVSEVNRIAGITADHLNGKLSDRDYLLALRYTDSWLNSVSDDVIAEKARQVSAKYVPFLNQPASENATEQPVQTDSVSINNDLSGNGQGNAVSPSVGQSNVEQSVQPVVEQSVEQPVQEQAQQEQATIPVDEKGNFLYYRAPVDVTLQSIADEQLEPEEVDAFIAANQAEADKNLKKIQDKAPKMGTNIAVYKKAKSEWQEKVADAQAQSDYWKQVKDELTAMRTRPGDTTAQDIAQLGEPLNGEELAAMMLGNGSLPLLRDSYMKELGAGNREAQGMFGLFASRDKGGMTIEEAGERLMEADRENGTNFFDQNDPNAGRNAIIDVLSSAKTKGDLTGFIRSNRERLAEQERQAEYAAYEQWCEDNFHMTPEEYESYIERMERENPFEGIEISELDAIFAESAAEYQNYLNEQENGRETEETGNAERGNDVLSEEQSDNEGGNSEVSGTGTAAEIGSEIVGNDEVAQRGESGEVNEDSDTPQNNEFVAPEHQEGENILDYAERVAKSKEIDDARKEVKTNPTEAQKEAGNYKKGHVKLDGYDITIENPKGSTRSGVDANGQPWSVTMNNDYGYIKGTEGVDGDHIDVFLSDDPTTGNVYVVDQVNGDGSFDEHKVMYGFSSSDEARDAYLANYSPGWKGLGTISEVSKDEFKKWINSSHRKTKPFAEYKSVKVEGAQNERTRIEPTNVPYSIEPAQYTTKRGKVLDMHLVKFTEPLSKEQQRVAKEFAKAAKGWYDAKQGGFMMRTEESAQELADTILNNSEAVEDAQPVSMDDVKAVNDGDIAFSEPKQAKEESDGGYKPVWQYNVSVDKATGRTTISRDDVSGPVPVGDARFRISTETPEEMLEVLRNPQNGMQELLDDIGVIIENKIKTRNLDREIKEQAKPANQSGNRLVTDERYKELKKRMRAKLGGQMNMGIDPEILAIGTEMAVYHIEKGARKFAEYAKAMIADLGDAIRPYLKAFYNGARDLPEVQESGYTDEMDSYDDVSRFDVANFDKDTPNILEAAETISKEQEVEQQAEVAKERIAKKRTSSKRGKQNKSLSLPQNDLFKQTDNNNEQGSTEPDSGVGNEARQEAGRTEQRGTDRGVHGNNESDTDRSGRVSRPASERKSSVTRNQNNYRFGENGIQVPSGEIAKLKANVEAIRTLKELEASGQPATDKQKEILSKYVGWGGLANALDTEKYDRRDSYLKDFSWNSRYLPYYEQLQELLTPEEFQSAIQSTTTSHYTPSDVIKALWNIVERSGFKGGVVSEPALGVGHIIGMMPESISKQSRISGYEIDSLSGRIASKLYPDADIKVQGYETNFAPQSKDLVITNVPFGKNAPYDKNLDRTLRRQLGNAYNLHNYFIAKGLLELKEGGIGVFVTSSATMDGADSRFREFVSGNNIDLIGAIRLPNDAFQKNAGTSVTADILVFRKRKTGEPSNGINFISTTQIGEGKYEEDGEMHTKPIMVNEYFAEHPEMMLGEMMTAFDAGSGGLYSGASQTLKPKAGADLNKELDEAIDKLPTDFIGEHAEQAANRVEETLSTDLRNGTITTQNGKVYVSSNGELVPVDAKSTFTFNGKERKTADAVNDYNSLKDTLRRLIHAEQTEDKDPKELRKELNEKYDSFVEKYGTLNRNKALDDVFAEDYEHNLPLSLEDVKRVPSATGKSMVWQVTKGKGILDKRVSYPVEEPTKADNLQDAVNISLSYKGVLDVPYISKLMGVSEEQVTQEMLEKGEAYRDPVTGSIVDKDSYLSGNVREKLEEARAAAENNPEYQKNVDDLAEVQPETIRFGDISYRLGTPWIPTDFINDFALNVLGIANAGVQFEPLLNEFVLSKRARIDDFAKAGLYKTGRVDTIDLFNSALNQRKPKIYDERTTYGPTGKSTERIPNEAETQAASEKIMEISDKFIEYIDGNTAIHRELERIYNDRYNNYRLKKYSLPSFSHTETDKDGNKVTVTRYPGASANYSMREHQAKAIQRSLHESTLLAHQVGTGKTFTMITTAMEMRRLGLARKPMIVVQNATLEDFVKDFYRLYPSANVLAPSKDERSSENRKRLFNLIATGDFDAIVIPQSFLAFIPDDEGRKAALVQKRIEDYVEAISKTEDYALQRRLQKEMQNLQDTLEGNDKKAKKSTVKQRANAAERAKSRTERILDRRTDDVMTFEKMGIDALFIDEAHNFKKIGFATKMNNVKGVDSGASQRANSLLLKARWVQEKNGGRNVILATGTPITNTMAEVWTMMNFVSPDILEAYNIQSFDDFATTFGTVEPSLEFTATGNFKIADRFKSYVNVPELLKAFRSHADVVLTEDVKEFKQSKNIPRLAGDKMENVVIDKNEDLEDVMQMLVKELEDYNKLSGKAKREKSALPLVVFTKAKQAAIDLRLLNPNYADNPNSKTNQVVSNIIKYYKESTPDKGTQLVFCDSYQSPGEKPKMDLFDYDPNVPRFNLYEDMKQKLIAAGIPEKEIAIVNNYDGERRKALFEKVRNGDVRVLLGSTEKMGVGVNVQDRLFALHHVDAPMRPMDFEQRNGRILRQGNLYATWDKPVHVLTYGVQGTLDATAYDRLRVKQEFINQMMKGNTDSRVMEEQDDEDPSGMTFSQMAATLSGDKTAQLLFAAQNKLKRLRNSKRSDANSKSSMAESITYANARIKDLQANEKVFEKASEVIDKHFPDGIKKVSVNGTSFIEKFGSSLDAVIDDYDNSYSLNRGIGPLKISLNDGAAEVIVHFNEGRMVYELYAGKEHIVENRQFNGGKGLMSSLDYQIESVKKNLADVRDNIEAQRKKIDGLEKAINAPWGREEELKEAEQEVEKLQKQLEEKAKDNTKGSNKNDTNVYRAGEGSLNDDELSLANDPLAKLTGRTNRTKAQRRIFAERERKRMVERVQELADSLHLDNVDIVTDTSTLEGMRKRAKGFYSRSTGRITIVIPNQSSVFDAEQTLLHEAVAHYGLRQLFGEHFDTFLENVYRNADEEIRRKIVGLAQRNGWDIATATEEYLASLAEDTNFDDISASWWNKIKMLFLRMLHKIGFKDFDGVTLSDNELRYILWRSYENLKEPGRYRSILGEAADIAKQNELKVGNYAQGAEGIGNVADDNLYRKTPENEETDDGSRDAYNKAVSGNRFKAQEAYQDSMLSLKRLQEVVAKYSGKPIQSFENAYMAENQMSSKNTSEKETYGEKFFKPMVESVGKLMKKGASYGAIVDYVIAKHGLERNVTFAYRDAELQTQKRFAEKYAELETLNNNGLLSEEDYQKRKDKLDSDRETYYNERVSKNLEKDYSGLTALAEKHDSEDDFKTHAEEVVSEFESLFDTSDLWDKINAATKETLRKAYESGMMSRDAYNKVRDQFMYYIPLRGWDETTAEDVYEYINSETSPVNSVLKSAKGRHSLADDPFATIGNMAESAIHQGNRNLMKQSFLNMAINHPTDVVTVKEAWYVQNPTTGDWSISFPDIQDGDSADVIADKVEEHEERMKELEKYGQATKVKDGLNIDYRIGARQAREHIVNVKRNGKDYLVFVNGNPRAAQAVNGLTNPDVEQNKVFQVIGRFNRELAANFTNRNPAFVLSNLSRDLIFSITAVNVKENPKYARRFARNIPRAMAVIARNLRGKGNADNADDKLFQEFLANGGETGYTIMHSVDEYKKMVKRELNKKEITGKTDYFKAVRACAQFFSTMNRWAEDVSRFTTYMTSRQMGRPITQAVNDAKEVTVNFNRRGAAAKTSGVFGWSAGIFRNLYLFFNAAVQSLANFGKLAKKNRKAFLTALGGFTAAGFAVPVLNAIAISLFGDDDDDYYGNLPEWVRKNNLCLYIPGTKDKFITIPLPIELRAFYGLGEMAYQETVGNEGSEPGQIAYKAVNQITELLPLNPLGNNGDIAATIMPDVLSPIWQAYENKDFTGKPIYRKNAFNENMPEWTKAYNSTADWLVDLSEWTNEIAGGDKYKRGEIPMSNWNPAIVEHLFESYFGGMAKTINQTAKTLGGGVESVLTGKKSDDLQWYSTPVLNRFMNDAGDDRSSFTKINQRYYKLYDLYEEVGKNLRGYSNEVAKGNLDYLDKLRDLYRSDDYKRYLIFKNNNKLIERIRKIEKKLPEESTEAREKIQKDLNKIKKGIVDKVEELVP